MSTAKNFENEIKAVIVNLLQSKGKNIPNILPDTKLCDILDYVELRRVVFTIDDMYKIDTHASVDKLLTFSDLTKVVTNLVKGKEIAREKKKAKAIYYNKALNNNINDILMKTCKRAFGKNTPEVTPNTQLRDVFDYLNLRRVVFEIDKSFQINTHAHIDNMDTVADLYNVVGNLVYTQTKNMIKPILKTLFDSKDEIMPGITPDTNLLNMLGYVDLRKLSFMIDKKIGIDSHALIDNVVKMKDLCIIVDKLRSEKLAKKNQAAPVLEPKERMFKHQKELVLKDIAKWLDDAWIAVDDKINFDSELKMDLRLTDFGVFSAIEQKYNIELPNLSRITTVGDLCEIIVKQRIKILHTDKHTYNKNVTFEAAPVIIPQKPAILERYGPYYHAKGHLPWYATLRERRKFYQAVKDTMKQRFL